MEWPIQDAKRSGRKTKLSNDHVKFIDDRMKENDELTSAELREKLGRVKRNVLGWKSETARYCQFVREQNKMKRFIFASNALLNKDTFEDVIFTDETTVQIEQYARICFRKDCSQPKRKGRPKHPLKVCKHFSSIKVYYVAWII